MKLLYGARSRERTETMQKARVKKKGSFTVVLISPPAWKKKKPARLFSFDCYGEKARTTPRQ